ncbi:MAG TPA: SPOR domain-containing protein [Gallionella sp.]|nr:SPOR domain-containing protein [Gallionella sp.]
MMRTVFWILLLVNVVFFAVMQWGVALVGEPPLQAQPVLHEDKVQLLAASQVAALPPIPVAASAVPSPSSAPVATPASSTPPKHEARVCLEWGEFSGPELVRIKAALAGLKLGDRLGRREVEYSNGYWVYIPSLKDKASVAQKIEQLKARGVEEYFVVQEAGPLFNAISLGVFKTRDAAQKFVNDLHARDVTSAQVGERNSKLKATVFLLSGVDAATSTRLIGMYKDFPGSDQKEVPCTH